jgi:integrase/recombinase XerD
MTTDQLIDEYVADQISTGRFNSRSTEINYRGRLEVLRDVSGDKAPERITRADVKRALRRWKPNTARTAHSIFRSFFDWMVEEGYRPDNPARQVKRVKPRPVSTTRMTAEEVAHVLEVSRSDIREWRAAHLMACAGGRADEVRLMQGRHLARPGLVWISSDIAKGGKEAWLPVVPELEPVVREIREHVADDEYVIPARRSINPPENTRYRLLMHRPTSKKALWEMIVKLGERSRLPYALRPHLLRHAFGDHVAKSRDSRLAQALLRHADVSTTIQIYTSRPSTDELVSAVEGFRFDTGSSTFSDELSRLSPFEPVKATTGIEPVKSEGDVGIRVSERLTAVEAEIRRLRNARYPEEVRRG